MRREGRQHGTVRIIACKLPPGHGPRTGAAGATAAKANGGPGARAQVSCQLMQESPPAAGAYARAPAKPTNHSKHAGKCKKAKCRECQHASPGTKSRDKAKGGHKLRSSDVLLNHRLASWRVVDGAGASLHPGFNGASASEILRQLSASRHSQDSDDLKPDERYMELLYSYGAVGDTGEPLEYGYDEHHDAEENVEYGYGEYDAGSDDMVVECVEPKQEEMTGPSSADDAGEEEDDDDTDMDYFVVGVAWEYSDAEDWLVVQEM